MHIRHIKIRNFRGIRELDWALSSDMVCLVGHGDSTKSTILDAIELALGGRWNMTLGESDFYLLNTAEPIRIEVTVGQLPEYLLSDARLGLFLRGWNPIAAAINDEPLDGDEITVTVRIEVSPALELTWRVVTDRHPDGKPLAPQDRDALGVIRIGDDADRHLTWSRGSALTKSTEKGVGVRQLLTEAHRKAREMIDKAPLEEIRAAAANAEESAKQMGAIVRDKYHPSLTGLLSGSPQGLLSLHDGAIPLASSGLGTRRLAALGLQSLAIPDGGIVLVDEIETGLEPHRLRHLLSKLHPQDGKGQVLFTTHSAVALIELTASRVHFVRVVNGRVTVTCLDATLQDLLRRMPEAFLGLRVLVAEGRTEFGMARGLEARWQSEHGDIPLTHQGVVIVDGGGNTKAKSVVERLRALGLPAAIFGDSDDPALDVGAEWQAATGAAVFLWPGSVSTEQRIALDLPWAGFKAQVALAIEHVGVESVRTKLGRELGTSLSADDPDDWLTSGIDEATLRAAFGRAAKAEKANWFKDIEWGERLGRLVGEQYANLTGTKLQATLSQVGEWLYDRG